MHAGLPYQPGSMVVMTAGTDFQRQSYKIANSLPFDWIRRKVRAPAASHGYLMSPRDGHPATHAWDCLSDRDPCTPAAAPCPSLRAAAALHCRCQALAACQNHAYVRNCPSLQLSPQRPVRAVLAAVLPSAMHLFGAFHRLSGQ